jgi:hypothetical protein
VIWLRPVIEDDRVLPQATISVWRFQPGRGGGDRWHLQHKLDVRYNGLATEGGTHAGN